LAESTAQANLYRKPQANCNEIVTNVIHVLAGQAGKPYGTVDDVLQANSQKGFAFLLSTISRNHAYRY
jgi:hypothetical protein